MKKDFKELEEQIRLEVLSYLTDQNIDLSNVDEVNGVLDTFYSETIIDYMEKNNLELGYRFILKEDRDIEIEVWEW